MMRRWMQLDPRGSGFLDSLRSLGMTARRPRSSLRGLRVELLQLHDGPGTPKRPEAVRASLKAQSASRLLLTHPPRIGLRLVDHDAVPEVGHVRRRGLDEL